MSRKYIVLLASLLFFTSNCFGQSESWQVLNIARPLTSINFISPTKGWIFGGDFSYKTIDGGMTWSLPIQFSLPVGSIPVFGIRSPETIFFIDSLRGWACQYSGVLLKTTNGSSSWNSVNTGFNVTLQSIFFINNNTGWAGGIQSYPLGVMIKTTNGGNNWFPLSQNMNHEVTNIFFINSFKGFYCSPFTDTIGITYNGGNNWTNIKVGNGQPVNMLFFKDTLNAWALGNYHYISKTTDGGLNWIVIPNQIGNTQYIYFLNLNTGWITDPGGGIWKSTNGGINWFVQRSGIGGSNGYQSYALDVYFKDENTGWVGCGNGIMLRTTNGGNNWSDINDPPLSEVRSLDFVDENTGWALCNFYNLDNFSYIFKTTNRGYNWINVYSITNVILNSLTFVNSITGYVCGDSGTVLKTTDGGNNWSNINYGNINQNSVKFLNTNTGYICGSIGSIIKTTNGGINWVNQQSNIRANLNYIQFVDQQNGFIAADSGYILKTVDGGENWNLTFPYNNKSYRAVCFINPNTGFVVGDSHTYNPYPISNTVVVKTINAGLNWTISINDGDGGYYYFSDVLFLNDQIGWVVSSDNGLGYIKKTTNGGLSWIQSFGPLGPDYYGDSGLNCIFSLGENYTWVGGGSGAIISTTSPISINPINFRIPEKFSLSQNYPNPFNPQTKIKFDISKQSFAKLIIYDILGREVATLVNEDLKPGTYSFDWDGSNYASGIYFYQLVVGDYAKTMKMVLIK